MTENVVVVRPFPILNVEVSGATRVIQGSAIPRVSVEGDLIRVTAVGSQGPPGVDGVDGEDGSPGAPGETGLSGSMVLWAEVPGSPARVSDTQFTVSDPGNSGLLDKVMSRCFFVRWLESGARKFAMISWSYYSSDIVSLDIIGDALIEGFTEMQYCCLPAMIEGFLIPGALPITNAVTIANITKMWIVPTQIYIISADVYLGTAGTGSRSNVIDINIFDGFTTASKFSSKPTLGIGSSMGYDFPADDISAPVLANSFVTIDLDNSTSTPGKDLYVYLYYCPVSWMARP